MRKIDVSLNNFLGIPSPSSSIKSKGLVKGFVGSVVAEFATHQFRSIVSKQDRECGASVKLFTSILTSIISMCPVSYSVSVEVVYLRLLHLSVSPAPDRLEH
ncbi:hypothetical protein Pmani_032056 [Petrolisthes manimaculis]|uniref:Uncharacterized protein n=1 Tax=Petrolisthes manimaculis TaxID=1843537 RepID=A0AAE1NTT7_9EUCA|nr:hypothetical protein Pmani_032056 [Petrolisthes manimaculis]